jgi:hypothetical protein
VSIVILSSEGSGWWVVLNAVMQFEMDRIDQLSTRELAWLLRTLSNLVNVSWPAPKGSSQTTQAILVPNQ